MLAKNKSGWKLLEYINIQEKVYVIGTVSNYQFETSKKPGKLILSDCFASR